MTLHRVASTSQFKELEPVFVELDGLSIAVYRFRDRYFAYLNRCPHQGGPACEGIVIARTEAEIQEDGHVVEYTSKDHYNIACPWHGVDYDLETGISPVDNRTRLRRYDVVVRDDTVMLDK